MILPVNDEFEALNLNLLSVHYWLYGTYIAARPE